MTGLQTLIFHEVIHINPYYPGEHDRLGEWASSQRDFCMEKEGQTHVPQEHR